MQLQFNSHTDFHYNEFQSSAFYQCHMPNNNMDNHKQPRCSMDFLSHDELLTHLIKCHQINRPDICKRIKGGGFIIVNREYYGQDQLESFIAREIGKFNAKKYAKGCRCGLCGRRLTRLDSLKDHVKQVHKIEDGIIPALTEIKGEVITKACSFDDYVKQLIIVGKIQQYCGKCKLENPSFTSDGFIQLHFELCHDNFIKKNSYFLDVAFLESVYADKRIFYSLHFTCSNKAQAISINSQFDCGGCAYKIKNNIQNFIQHVHIKHNSVIPKNSNINGAHLISKTDFLKMSEGQKNEIYLAESQYLQAIESEHLTVQAAWQQNIIKKLTEAQEQKDASPIIDQMKKLKEKTCNNQFGYLLYDYLLKLMGVITMNTVQKHTQRENLDELLRKQSQNNIGIPFLYRKSNERECLEIGDSDIYTNIQILQQIEMKRNREGQINLFLNEQIKQNVLLSSLQCAAIESQQQESNKYARIYNKERLKEDQNSVKVQKSFNFPPKVLKRIHRNKRVPPQKQLEFKCLICKKIFYDSQMLAKHKTFWHP